MAAKYDALDIANLYIDLANSVPGETIDNMKLNKLCYYAQGWSIVRLGYPLFSDRIEAWKYGPIIKDVYFAYKVCGDRPIGEPTYHFDESRLTSEEASLLVDVYSTYGKYTSVGLANKTHAYGSPWQESYQEGMNRVIPQSKMKEYFRNSNELEVFTPNMDKVVDYAGS